MHRPVEVRLGAVHGGRVVRVGVVNERRGLPRRTHRSWHRDGEDWMPDQAQRLVAGNRPQRPAPVTGPLGRRRNSHGGHAATSGSPRPVAEQQQVGVLEVGSAGSRRAAGRRRCGAGRCRCARTTCAPGRRASASQTLPAAVATRS